MGLRVDRPRAGGIDWGSYLHREKQVDQYGRGYEKASYKPPAQPSYGQDLKNSVLLRKGIMVLPEEVMGGTLGAMHPYLPDSPILFRRDIKDDPKKFEEVGDHEILGHFVHPEFSEPEVRREVYNMREGEAPLHYNSKMRML